MLQTLHIQNLILIESAEIVFSAGFNVLSGETGAGKSAVLAALALVAGGRSDSSLVRAGAERAIVEAVFHPADQQKIVDLFEGTDIELEKGSLCLRRELTASGRSRAFINDQLISLALLKSIGERLVELIGQHASQHLRDLESHRTLVDLFGDLEPLVSRYARAWKEENRLHGEKELLVRQETERIRDTEILALQLEELEVADLKEGEEEELFQEYTKLHHVQDLLLGAERLSQVIGEEALPALMQEKQLFQQLSKLDVSLKENEEAYQRLLVELQEIRYGLDHYVGRLEQNPQRLSWLNERLALISRLKKKYGPTFDELVEYRTQVKEKVCRLQGAEARLEQLESELKKAELETRQLALELTAKRVDIAKKLEKALTIQLRALNMPKVFVEFRLTTQKRTQSGEDAVEIFFMPNVGERLLPLKECGSGGELSRFMLALRAVLASKAGVGTLIFDEIDANIGGETASVVARKLAELGGSLQLLCITHFPQVARFAATHLQIVKEEREGRTRTLVHVLEGERRERELQRMAGD